MNGRPWVDRSGCKGDYQYLFRLDIELWEQVVGQQSEAPVYNQMRMSSAPEDGQRTYGKSAVNGSDES